MNKDVLMLCESIHNEAEVLKLDNKKFIANIKYDGCRVMAIKKGEDIILFGRGNTIYNSKFKEVVEELKQIKEDFIIDGEIISYDNNFGKLQKRVLTKDFKKIEKLQKEIPIKYMIFDIISIRDNNIMNEILSERLIILNDLFNNYSFKNLELVEYGDISLMLQRAKDKNGEGIIIKDRNGTYESKRSKNWIKYKLFKETTLTITGFTENPAGIRGTDNNENAVQISGHNANEVKAVMEKNGYCDILVQYLSISKDGKMRFPSYRGLK